MHKIHETLPFSHVWVFPQSIPHFFTTWTKSSQNWPLKFDHLTWQQNSPHPVRARRTNAMFAQTTDRET